MDDKIKAYVRNNIQKTAQTYKKIGQQYVNNAKFTFDVGREVAKAPAFLGKTAATGLIKIPTQSVTNGRVDLAKNKYIGKAFMTDREINQVSSSPTAPLKFLGQNVLAGAKTAATAFGAPAMATIQGLTSLGVSSLLGAGLNKAMGQDPRQGAVQGVAMSPVLQGITRYTNPLIERGVSKFAPTIANKIPAIAQKYVSEGIARVPGNVFEGGVIDATLGRRPLSLGSAAIDAATAFIPGNPNLRNTANNLDGVNPKAYSMHPEDVGDLDANLTAYKTVKGFTKEDRAQQLKTIQNIVEHYIPGWKHAKTSDLVKAAENLMDIATGKTVRQSDFPRMGLVEGGTPQAVTATATPKTQEKIRIRNIDAERRTARQDYEEWSRAVKQQEAPRTTTGAVNTAVKAMKTSTVSPVARDVGGYKDISGFNGQARDVYRNFKQVFGNKYADVKRTVLDPFDSSKGKFTRNLDNWADQLDTNIVKKYGFNKGSRESAAIQQYGEGTKDFRQLVEEFGDTKAKNIVEADKWFRQQYDSLLGEVNAIRAKIYPNDPEKIIPRRSDYYRHFKEMQEGFSGLVNIFDTPANIQSGLSGISASTKPKSKWLSFAQKRLGGESDIDAVGGFINYVKAAEYAKNIDPHISRFRALREELAQATDIGTPQAGKLNNFLEFLDNYANDLSGKTSTADRFIQTVIPGGRKTMSVINWANNRVKANVILGNASSSMAQIMNVPSGVASAGPIASIKGLGRTVASIFDDNKAIKQSDFIAERYSGGTFDRFDRGMVKNTKKMAAWMIQVLDEVGTKYIWNSHYEKALSEGVPNPVKYADDFTREMVAGRGIGEVPLIQKSKVFQLIAPFQLEVGNLWHVMGGMVSEKQFGKLATLFVSSYILNRAIEKVRGSDVSFDPINASIEAYQTYMEEEDKGKAAIQAGGRMAGEVLSNIPFGQSVAAMYPEYGFKVGESQAPTREDLFGKGDPTRYGSGLLLTKGLQDPLFKLLLPFGGQQLKRTIEGIKSVGQGYAESASDKVQYPIEKNARNFLQAGIFGKYSIPEAQDYFNENRSVLGDKQSETFKNAQDPNAVYDKVMADRASKKDTSSSTINFEDEAKLRLEEGSGVAYAPGKIYYKDINGDVKSINTGSVTGLSEDNKYLKAIKNSKAFTIADDIIESNLPDEVKNQALSDIGIDREDAEYYSIASQSNDLKSIYLLEVAQAFVNNSGNRQDMIDVLVSQRRKVNGDMIASDGVLDNLYNDGYITNEERKALKDIDFDAEGKLKVKPSSGGKKLKAVKAPTYKLSRKARQKLRKPKLASIKLEGSKKLKTTKPKKFAPIKLVNSKK